MNNPAIVVVAYNRPNSLQRLLDSLAAANYAEQDIPLIISIDRSEDSKTQEVAQNFEWKQGEKTIITAEKHLGLKSHVLTCGQLTQEYENIIVLEDDLMVSPDFYAYSKEAISFYKDSQKVVSISLYNYKVTESSFQPFDSIEDGSDVYFMKFTSSWGQIWSKDSWAKFTDWLKSNQNGKPDLLPSYIQEWGGNSWKKLFINFMLDQDYYSVFPRVSYTTNFEDPGTHATTKGLFQVPLGQMRGQNTFVSFEDSGSIHDEYFELVPSLIKDKVPELAGYEFDVDLLGGKSLERIQTEYVLTNRAAKNAEMSFSDELRPFVSNVLNGLKGNAIHLSKKENVISKTQGSKEMLKVAVVIPLLEFDQDQLELTLTSIDEQSYLARCIMVGSESELDKVRHMASNYYSNFTFLISDDKVQDDLLQIGLAFVKSEICTWVNVGSKFENGAFLKMNQILSRYTHINYLNSSSSTKNLAPHRWTLSKAIKLRKSWKIINTEGWFFRSSHFKQLLIDEDLAPFDFALRILNRDCVFTSSEEFFNTDRIKNIQTKEDLKIEIVRQKQTFIRQFLASAFKWFFEKNITLLRFIYVEAEGINPVVRYDAKHDSFYLARY